jgi:toxin ParE1/3/4
MTRLVVTSDAEADFNDIIDYLSSEAGSAVAADYVRKFRVSLARLIDLSAPGSTPARARRQCARIGVVPPYVLIYDFTAADDTLMLLRIVHGKRNITNRLLGSR